MQDLLVPQSKPRSSWVFSPRGFVSGPVVDLRETLFTSSTSASGVMRLLRVLWRTEFMGIMGD